MSEPCPECGEPKGCHLATCSRLTSESYKVRGDNLGLSDYDNGFRAGAEAMREAAAKACELVYRPGSINYESTGRVAPMIRVLPLPEPHHD